MTKTQRSSTKLNTTWVSLGDGKYNIFHAGSQVGTAEKSKHGFLFFANGHDQGQEFGSMLILQSFVDRSRGGQG